MEIRIVRDIFLCLGLVAEKKGGIKSPVPMIMADRKEKCFSHPGNKLQKNPENTM
jgi:hypothetical protein